MKHLTTEQVLFIHGRLIDKTGGSHGLRDLELLQSAISKPKATFSAKELYPDIFYNAAAAFLMESIVKNRPFIDGNKRTAIASAYIFLKRNGYFLRTTQKELVKVVLNLAIGNISVQDVVKWFKKYSSK